MCQSEDALALLFCRVKGMKRSIRFGLLLNTSEKQALACLAEAEGGLSQGAMVRSLIRQAARERGLWPPSANQQAQVQDGQEVER